MKILSGKGFITAKYLDEESNLFRFVAFATEEFIKNTTFESGRAYKAELTSPSLSIGYEGEVVLANA